MDFDHVRDAVLHAVRGALDQWEGTIRNTRSTRLLCILKFLRFLGRASEPLLRERAQGPVPVLLSREQN